MLFNSHRILFPSLLLTLVLHPSPVMGFVPSSFGTTTHMKSTLSHPTTTQPPPPSSSSTSLNGILSTLKSLFTPETTQTFPAPCIMGDETLMSQKGHGTSTTPVQSNLRWNCDTSVADRICNFNRHYAEYRGYWTSTSFLRDAQQEYRTKGSVTFYDSNSGKPLFVAPRNRSWEDFVNESLGHGWPSFRDEEVVWENVRCLPDGEAVSVDGTHLGHNLPDYGGSRYCINLVSVAGRPVQEKEEEVVGGKSV